MRNQMNRCFRSRYCNINANHHGDELIAETHQEADALKLVRELDVVLLLGIARHIAHTQQAPGRSTLVEVN